MAHETSVTIGEENESPHASRLFTFFALTTQQAIELAVYIGHNGVDTVTAAEALGIELVSRTSGQVLTTTEQVKADFEATAPEVLRSGSDFTELTEELILEEEEEGTIPFSFSPTCEVVLDGNPVRVQGEEFRLVTKGINYKPGSTVQIRHSRSSGGFDFTGSTIKVDDVGAFFDEDLLSVIPLSWPTGQYSVSVVGQNNLGATHVVQCGTWDLLATEEVIPDPNDSSSDANPDVSDDDAPETGVSEESPSDGPVLLAGFFDGLVASLGGVASTITILLFAGLIFSRMKGGR